MTKWFYTDPLAAAWMTKRFGMRFSFDGGLKYHEERTLLLNRLQHDEPPFYIHPDSLHLLEPRADDIVIDQRTTGAEVCGRVVGDGGSTVALAVPERKNGKDCYFSNPVNCRILQRDGKAFHWPEREP